MGQTPGGLWIPDENTPAGSLHTILAQMQLSVEGKLTALDVKLAEPYPVAAVGTTGTPQAFIAGSEFNLSGGGSGWAVGSYNIQASQVGIAANPGVRSGPIVIQTAGLYAVSYSVTHTLATVGAPDHAYTDIVFSGSANAVRRNVWSLGYQTSNTEIVGLPAGSTSIGLRGLVVGSAGSVFYAEIAVWKFK